MNIIISIYIGFHELTPTPLCFAKRGYYSYKVYDIPFFCLQENPACGIDEVNGAWGMSSWD